MATINYTSAADILHDVLKTSSASTLDVEATNVSDALNAVWDDKKDALRVAITNIDELLNASYTYSGKTGTPYQMVAFDANGNINNASTIREGHSVINVIQAVQVDVNNPINYMEINQHRTGANDVAISLINKTTDDDVVLISGVVEPSGSTVYISDGNIIVKSVDSTVNIPISVVQGSGNTMSGNISHIEGANNIIYSDYSHAEGYYTTASADSSHVEGTQTKTYGFGSHAEGDSTIASGFGSHTEGAVTTALLDYSHAEGYYSNAIGYSSHAEGGDYNSEFHGGQAIGNGSHAEGNNTMSVGLASHAEGKTTLSLVDQSHAEGFNTIANGNESHSEGLQTLAGAGFSVPNFNITTVPYTIFIDGDYSNYFGIGDTLYTTGDGVINPTIIITGLTYDSINNRTEIDVDTDIADFDLFKIMATQNVTNANHSEGHHVIAFANYSHAEGYNTLTSGNYSHAEGYNTVSIGLGSHSQGKLTQSIGDYSFSTGDGSVASRYTQQSFASGAIEFAGDSQYSKIMLNASTQGITPALMQLNSANFIFDKNSFYKMRLTIMGHGYDPSLTGFTSESYYSQEFLVKNSDQGLEFQPPFNFAPIYTWNNGQFYNITVSGDTGTDELIVEATGYLNDIVKFTGYLEFIENKIQPTFVI